MEATSAETKEPAANAYFTFGTINRLALIDENGYFKFLLPDSLTEKQTILRIVHHQFVSRNIIAKVNEFPDVIELTYFEPAEVIVGGELTIAKRKWWQRRKKYCK